MKPITGRRGARPATSMSIKAWILPGVAFLMSIAQAAAADLQTQLLDAIRARDVAAVRAALDAGADPNEVAEYKRTPLHLAVRESTEAAELLLDRGANPNAADEGGRVPLHLANGDSAALLLKRKANFLVADAQEIPLCILRRKATWPCADCSSTPDYRRMCETTPA